jgi:hypothetical protein
MEPSSDKPFGEALRDLMAERGLTFRSLAEATRLLDGKGMTHAHADGRRCTRPASRPTNASPSAAARGLACGCARRRPARSLSRRVRAAETTPTQTIRLQVLSGQPVRDNT